ncbi:HAD family phosphatase [Bifidobacterium sp. UBA6881]|uniref:HAD family hydrolase n=1 Tax=Bifidobacterium sp. UBA6881 TaxID=1946109 RepID=UPI000EDA3E0E|nr:HAD family phosphatase [Bifidobacterium sp. UBA6881]HAK71248.1 HAD family phosphatase [Bifidobacterium sp.]
MTETTVSITDVVFDFCGVLLDWQTRACLQGKFDDAIVDRICADDDPCGFFGYEDRMDAGEDFDHIYPDVVREQGEELAEIFRYYIAHYDDALPCMLPGMEQLLRDLKAAGYGVWGLTNWSHETFHFAFEKFPQLAELLQDTVVSGVEKLHKPNADIYELALSRFDIAPESSVFLDDTSKNVTGARAVGMHAFRFTDAQQARRDLASLGMRF